MGGAKFETAIVNTNSSLPSPPSQYQQSFAGTGVTGSPAPVYASGYLDQQVMPQQQFQGQEHWHPSPSQEMPITKPEGNLQEMAGNT